MKIIIETIPHERQRYNTQGDWFLDDNGDLQIRVSEAAGHEPFLIAYHELTEAYLCLSRGITDKDLDKFDFRVGEYCMENDLEPGDLADSIYRKEHRFAMLMEHLMAHELGVIGYGSVR